MVQAPPCLIGSHLTDTDLEDILDESTKFLEMRCNNEPVKGGLNTAAKSLEALEIEDSTQKMPERAVPGSGVNDSKLRRVQLKLLSVLLLACQTTGQTILIRLSKAETDDSKYANSTVIFFAEVVKTLASLALVVYESENWEVATQSVREHFPAQPLVVGLHSLICIVQNNLLFYSLEKLSAPVQQVLYQMKILTVSGLGVFMLGKRMTAVQWSACLLLAAGVIVVQWPRQQVGVREAHPGMQLEGFLAVAFACLMSSSASVLVQKALRPTLPSIWMQNLRSGLYGSLLGLAFAWWQDQHRIVSGGFCQGYSAMAICVICVNGLGGLLCAAVMRYIGTALGCLSTACSLLFTSLLSSFLQDFEPDLNFAVGAFLSLSACVVFGLSTSQRSPLLEGVGR